MSIELILILILLLVIFLLGGFSGRFEAKNGHDAGVTPFFRLS